VCGWIKKVAVALVCVFLSVAAHAAINPDTLIIQDESSGNPTAQSPSSTASGLFGDTNSTWAEALAACGCGTTAEYATAASAPASLQIAANNALINQNGLSDWLCAGCDAPFAAQVAADGGVSAFQTSGLDTNPADFASLDTTAGLQAYLAGGTIGPTTGTPGTISAAVAAGGVTAVGSFHVFSWLWTQYADTIQTPINNDTNLIFEAIDPGVNYLLIIVMAIIGICMMFGKADMWFFTNRFARAASVSLLFFLGTIYYIEYVVQPVEGLPTYFSQTILGNTSANPAAGFDVATASFFEYSSNAHWNLIFDTSETVESAVIYFVALLIFFGGLLVIFGAWLVAQVLTQLLLMVGPIFILGFLFDKTFNWAMGWVGELVHQAVVTLGLLLLTALILNLVQQAFNQIPAVTSGVAAMEGLFGVALAAGLLSITVPVFWKAVSSIFAAAGSPQTHPARFLSGAAGAAVGATGAVINNITKVINKVPGPSIPPGRSLSRP
jgi:type IV secretion system protein VirB6